MAIGNFVGMTQGRLLGCDPAQLAIGVIRLAGGEGKGVGFCISWEIY